MSHWAEDAVIYHVYPLGACGAPARNALGSPPEPRLERLLPWLAHARQLGATALLLGPVFESSGHGYDTVDLCRVDRRLGTDAALARLVDEAHHQGLKVMLDAVFGHVGRDFWAFRDLRSQGPGSAYRGWFRGVDFSRRSRLGDSFAYEYWKDAPELPRLDLSCPSVREHLVAALEHWLARFAIDGLRLDSADWLDGDFLTQLRRHCDARHPDLWLMGEVVHGDYRRWVNPDALHSVTNYEAYKGLWSSHVDRNFFEIAYSLEREFGQHGLYRGLPLYNFADNHDVNRVASMVRQRAHLFSLYCLLFTMPGVPSIYAGSEWGITGTRTPCDDRALRPELDLEAMHRTHPADLIDAMGRLMRIRQGSPAVRRGSYRQLAVSAEQLAFLRQYEDESVVVVVSCCSSPTTMSLQLPIAGHAELLDLLNPPARFPVRSGHAEIDVPSCWARILRLRG